MSQGKELVRSASEGSIRPGSGAGSQSLQRSSSMAQSGLKALKKVDPTAHLKASPIQMGSVIPWKTTYKSATEEVEIKRRDPRWSTDLDTMDAEIAKFNKRASSQTASVAGQQSPDMALQRVLQSRFEHRTQARLHASRMTTQPY
eukprot:gnl/MRDRNA2_/MRDRNA2_110960_c0_seq1.p1 gnl/MRDRNA2_/MRDRNA2_110960_c0~~gnl/MRDRNA2_/MRDRNA2_110960_c0_seq1.p1  ORF type:complete len:164 (+),score=23.27 gnl/MRDRNA2_/MRDRNA2_110960_c0_seq1:60-494(+)